MSYGFYPEPKTELQLEGDDAYILAASLLQSYNIMTDPEGYLEAFLEHSDEFRQENRQKVIRLLKKLGWDDPQKPMRSRKAHDT